jgi:hypothetical protein
VKVFESNSTLFSIFTQTEEEIMRKMFILLVGAGLLTIFMGCEQKQNPVERGNER